MSKNYDVMQEAEIRLGVLPVSQRETDLPSFGATQTQRNGRGALLTWDDEQAREESAKLVRNVFLLQAGASPRVVVFAGIESGNGCSATCLRTAITLANRQLGSVCLVDANLRTPSLSDHFGVANSFGLANALATEDAILTFTRKVGPEHLHLLSSGSVKGETQHLINSDRMRARIADLRQAFDYVLIDTPPLNLYDDGYSLGQLSDGLLLILEANATRREVASKVASGLLEVNINILGAVLNKRTYPIPKALYKRL